jgi:hypothetical protein
MADGVAAVDSGAKSRLHARSDFSGLSQFLFSRNGLLSIWIVLGVIALGAGVYFATTQHVPLNVETGSYAVAVSGLVLLLPVLLLLTDPEATLGLGPRLALPVATTFILIALASFAVVDALSWRLLEAEPVRLAFFDLLAIVFLSRAVNGIAFARFKEGNRRAAEAAAKIDAIADAAANRGSAEEVERKIREYRSAEAASAFIVTVIVVLIIGGAYYVGTFPTAPSLGAGLGVGIFLTVISLFAIVLCIDWLADMKAVRGAGRVANALAKPGKYFAAFYDWIDGQLVDVGGHMAGADHVQAPSRYLILGFTLLSLGVIGWYLPPPFGLAPVLIGLVLGLSMSRIWSWVEEDRNLASITQFSPKAPQRIGFREDFRDETLLGFIFVLALIPVGMMQAHESQLAGGPLFINVANPDQPIVGDNFLVWLGYFGFELAKALPIVDWADIYQLGPGGDSIEPTRPLGMHAVFIARALVDLLLIAALLQAMGIASRNRQQKFLYAEGHIDRLDELVEKTELNRAIRTCRDASSLANAPTFTLNRLATSELVDFRRYNEPRLRALFVKTLRLDLRAFIGQVFAERGIKPAPAMNIVQDIAASHRSELDLMRTFDEAKDEDDAGVYKITIEDITSVLFELRNASGMRELKFELIDYARRFEAPAYLDMLTTVAVGAGRDAYIYTRRHAAEAIIAIAPSVLDREALSTALDSFERRGPELFGASRHVALATIKALREQLARAH